MDITTLYSEESEKAVLGAVLTGQYLTVKRIIDASDLFLERHRIIYNSAQNVFSQYGNVDATMIADALNASKQLELIGGRAYLTQLMNSLESATYTEVYAHMVKRIAVRRKLHEYTASIDDMLDADKPINDIIKTMMNDLKQLQAPDIEDHVISFSESLSTTYDIIADRATLYEQNKQYTLGIRTDLHDVDRLLDGLRPGDVNILAGYTGAGKSACAFTMAINAAKAGINRATVQGAKVMLFSGEMTQLAMNNRIMSMETDIPVRVIERGAFTQQDYVKYMNAVARLESLPLRMKRSTRLSVDDLPSLVEQEIERNGLDLLILDGVLQLDTDVHADQDWLRINAIMEALESVAIDYNISILATHQIGRSGADGRPTLSDLKRSSAVEEKAARVMLLWKPDDKTPEAREILIAKNRHGSTGAIGVYFDTTTTKFASIAH
jgi:replicative DNA helicase